MLLLQARRSATARELSEHLGVSMRTVYRDVDALSETGIPIYSEPGRAGGYRLVDGYRTTLTGLTSQESLALFLIGMPVQAASLGLTQQARSAELKLLAALGQGHREQANRLRDRFLLDLPPWYTDAETPPDLPELAGAVLSNKQVRVRYWRWTEPREVHRLLDPYGLVIKNGTWYLVAADRTRRTSGSDRMRVYRVSNIQELETRGDTFERPEAFDLTEFWRGHLAEFDRQRITTMARIKVSPALLERLPDLSDRSLEKAVAAGSPDDRGWQVADLPIETLRQAAAHLIRYGDEVEVTEPEELCHELARLAGSVLRQYTASR